MTGGSGTVTPLSGVLVRSHNRRMKPSGRLLSLVAVAAVLCAAAVAVWLQTTAGGPLPSGFLQFAAVALGATAFGAFVVWHRPGNRYGLVHLAVGVLFGGVVLAAAVLSRAAAHGGPPGLVQQLALAWSWLATAPLLPLWVMVIATFPDGRFHRGVVRVTTVALAVVMPFLAVTAYLLAPSGLPPPLVVVEVPAGLAGPLAPPRGIALAYQLVSAAAQLLGIAAPMGALVALLHRYRTSGLVVRQQIKWLLAGAATSVALQAIPVDALQPEALRTAAGVLVVLAVPLPLIAAAGAIVRHRLWDIDVVISKGLVYALVSGAVSALFLLSALVAGVTVGGRDMRVVAAVAFGLLVSFLAQPLRHRLEKAVARLLYGPEPRGLTALAGLDDAASVDAEVVASRVADVAQRALGASWAGVWLYLPHDGDGVGSFSPVAVAGLEPGVSAVVPKPVVTAIAHVGRATLSADLPSEVVQTLLPLFSATPAVVAPLTQRGAVIGLVACGGRERDRFTDEDLVVLNAIARQAALGLRNAGLERELRQRLAQIERQAVQLHESRQRLVTTQDDERRRIERDLHDGVQQQLVALAARLRREARGDRATAAQALEEIADQAEEAVFALQELARGIYPSLLADQGLQSALQVHAARLPADVRLEVEPRLRGRRLHPDVEAALYFVALEAMTNAVKHGPGACILVSLSSDAARHAVVLQVHDDGPGFNVSDRVGGTGLQNMADRVEAAGGVLAIDSVPGGGTWIRAEVADVAQVSDITARKATP